MVISQYLYCITPFSVNIGTPNYLVFSSYLFIKSFACILTDLRLILTKVINRDDNAVNKMIKIVNYYLDKKERPLKYRRDYDLEKRELKQKMITSIKNDTYNREVKYQPSSK